jgi:UDPglucose 6-dehydrogenase
MRISVLGTGYVGLVTGAALAHLGNQVVCHDIDRERIDLLRAGRLPFYEPHLDEVVQPARRRGNLIFVSGEFALLNEADVIFICVGTPSLPGGKGIDLRFVRAAATQIGEILEPGRRRVVVNKSTVPLGSRCWVETLVKEVLHRRGRRREMELATVSNPEFLREGSAVYDVFFPDRIVIGTEDEWAVETLHELYRPIIERSFTPPASLAAAPSGQFSPVPFLWVSPAGAELIKYAANAFLATKISFINEIANICEVLGADVREVATGLGLDRRIGPEFLAAGVGWGGSCFGKDLNGLMADARAYGYEPALLRAVFDLNYRQRMVVVKKLQNLLKTLRGMVIAVYGLSFKPQTDDLRDAPSLDVIKKLVSLGALVRVFDPVATGAFRRLCPDPEVKVCHDPDELVEGADGLVIVTEWPQVKELDWERVANRMRRKIIVDGRNVLAGGGLEQYGFAYQGVGIPVRPG